MKKKRKVLPWPKGRKPDAALAAKSALEVIPTFALVSTIDMMIQIISERGETIRDWDDKQKIVRRMECIGNRIYILAPREPPETEDTDGKHGDHSQGG